MDEKRLAEGIDFLAQGGLNLFAILDCAALPPDVTALLATAVTNPTHGRLVITAHGGTRFWHALQQYGLHTEHPVDHYSLSLTRQFIHRCLDDAGHQMLYPQTDIFLPLTRLGDLAGWSTPSPLGLGIHPQFGLWFAYRTVFYTRAPLPVITTDPAPSPCATCAQKPCLAACPPGAVQVHHFDVFACADFRVAPGSPCAGRCLARLACPVAPEHRYSLPQLQYHYGRSLATIRQVQSAGKKE